MWQVHLMCGKGESSKGVEYIMEMIKAFCSYSSVLSQKEYLSILESFYKYNSNVLLSLYDIRYYLNDKIDLLQNIFNRVRFVFLDSGVYEAEAYSIRGLEYNEWNSTLYLDTLKWILSEFDLKDKVYITNYDKPLSLNLQIETAIETFKEINNEFNHINPKYVFIIHTNPLEVEDWKRSNIRSLAPSFGNAVVIAIPEKELGHNLSDKIKSIKILNSHGYPLHILGCLDPTHIIIYALAGARYFDGLNWLKFYFNNKLSYYRNLYEIDLIIGNVVDPRSYVVNNSIYIDKLINDLEYSIANEDYSTFEEEQLILSKLT